ncbi:metalloregulator ArsR/SmtB family transcription factor [Paraburkholderia sp. 1N]|uniref:Metalloregulator ArsR/SmtB family transcription factor n=1 Tax=Paraburkholderia solitsugae TaxID=2675748 RepID=A0ABX2BP39_9BURK|nr:metalloregulator ArsR/SmtB family transcription factor [Paraburkholderia solitsugae]
MSQRDKPVAGHARAKAAMLRSSAQIFAALGDETRLRLIAVLCAGSAMSIAQLTAGTEITRQSVTQHLQVLANAGLVRDVKVGRERLWAFEPAHLDEARRALEAISQQWDQALLRLKAAVEG